MQKGKTKGEEVKNIDRIILFDGVCNLCNRLVQFIIKRDPKARFKFAAIQSGYAKRILSDQGFTSEKVDFIIYIGKNKIHKKSTAVLLILRDLGGIWLGFYLLIFFPRFLRDFLYDKIAGRRYSLFGKRETCMIPSSELKDRFPE